MKCPYRKRVINERRSPSCNVTKVDWEDCLGHDCPYYEGKAVVKCRKVKREIERSKSS